MPGRLVQQWEFRSGSDWITAIDGAAGQLLAVGSRDGHLALVDRYGANVGGEDYGSWIGAVRLVSPPGNAPAMLWLGTKGGEIVCADIVPDGPSRFRIAERYRFSARNTIRDIAVSALGPGERTVAVGSEDRRVYLFSHDAVAKGAETGPVEYETNGWIRSVAFCRTQHDEAAVAAGCGDKRLYVLTPEGEPIGDVWIGAKIHSIAADERSARIYCTSDARNLDVVGWRGADLEVIHRVALPHRATRLVWSDDSCSVLLAVCEDATIYAFDLKTRKLASHVVVGERVFSAAVPSGTRPGTVLLGLAGGRLLSCSYALERGLPAQPPPTHDGLIGDGNPTGPESLAEARLHGPKTDSVAVGIGRFVDIIPARPHQEAICIVGTDEGLVSLIPLAPGSRRRVTHVLNDFQPERVWAVRGAWVSERCVAVDVATSGRKVVSQQLQWDAGWENVSVSGVTDLALADWPREIRSLEGELTTGVAPLVVACENGELHVTGRDLTFNTGEILRTAAAVATPDHVRTVVGSDNNSIAEYHDARLAWRYRTRDRVREVLLEDDDCVAVSEDRFLYVLDSAGALVRRFRFPHRALCVASYPRVGDARCYVVGCGDGSLYVLEEDGGVVARYSFPDRIRDVRVVEDRELVVACEDGFLYFAPVMRQYLLHEVPDHREVVEETVQELREHPDGVVALSTVPEAVQLLLLMYLDAWCELRDSELALALVDSVGASKRVQDQPLAALVYAQALLVLAQRVSVPAALSRMIRVAETPASGPYGVHALAITVLQPDATSRQLAEPGTSSMVLVDALVQRVQLADEWVREEFLRALARSGFLEDTESGFASLGAASGISFSVLNAVVEDARRAAPVAVQRCGLVNAIDRLSQAIDAPSPGEEPDGQAAAFQGWAAELATLRDTPTRTDAARALSEWMDDRIDDGAIGGWASSFLASDFTDLESGRARFRHVAQRFWTEYLQRDPEITGGAFITALAFHTLAEALGRRHDNQVEGSLA